MELSLTVCCRLMRREGEGTRRGRAAALCVSRMPTIFNAHCNMIGCSSDRTVPKLRQERTLPTRIVFTSCLQLPRTFPAVETYVLAAPAAHDHRELKDLVVAAPSHLLATSSTRRVSTSSRPNIGPVDLDIHTVRGGRDYARAVPAYPDFAMTRCTCN